MQWEYLLVWFNAGKFFNLRIPGLDLETYAGQHKFDYLTKLIGVEMVEALGVLGRNSWELVLCTQLDLVFTNGIRYSLPCYHFKRQL